MKILVRIIQALVVSWVLLTNSVAVANIFDDINNSAPLTLDGATATDGENSGSLTGE